MGYRFALTWSDLRAMHATVAAALDGQGLVPTEVVQPALEQAHGRMRAVVDATYAELRAHPTTAIDAAADHAFFTAPLMPHKALVRMRLTDAGDVYVPVNNPLR